jgi:predicted dehydrogenase
MAKERWRMGIIGCGAAAASQARAIQALSDRVMLRAVADIDADVAQDRAEAWGAPTWATDYHDILDAGRLDAVSICLPHRLHASAAVAAAEAGLHILMEKPLAVTLEEADQMIAAAEKAGVVLMVGETARFDATSIKAAELIAAGVLGDLFLLRVSREIRIHDYLWERPWFLEDASGGVVYSGAIHDFERVRMLGGEVEHVYALAGPKVLDAMEAEDNAVVLAGLESGASAVLVESFSLQTPDPGVHVTAHGSKGSLWFHGDRIRLSTLTDEGEPADKEITVPDQDAFEAEIAHFLDCLETGEAPLTSGREERKPLAAVVATYASMERGARVYLSDLG